jgi:peptidoglycan/xylan/chitin deacetylase (PgdA/CDA1 family)
MILLVVNYHYVAAEPPTDPRGIFPVSVAELRSQVELLGRTLEFVSRDQLLAGDLPERSCLVTFDDGLRCQYELALPVLESLGVPALFFVPGRPLAEGRALDVHKVHRLVEDRVLGRLELDAAPEEEATRHYAYDHPEVARIKYLLNVVLSPAKREEILADFFAADEAAFCADLYLSADEVATLEREYASVGAHSYAHEPLARLDAAAIRNDLARNVEVLTETTGQQPLTISYPHGSVSPAVTSAAAAAGFLAGFTMERALNRSLEEPLLLARVDANDAPGGRRPLPEINPLASPS